MPHIVESLQHRSVSEFATILLTTTFLVPFAIGAEKEGEEWIEEIIVTAEKREERILDVPLTMSAFNARMIEELGMTGEDDLETMVPGLQFGYDSEGNGISMRGVGTQKAVQTQADSAVAFYVDGVFSYKTYGTAPNLFDLERIEVARGPQGTMNGRSAIAGSVSFVTQKPTDTFDLNLEAEFTDQVTQRYGIAFGGPITDNFSYRITGSYHEGDGSQENVGTGGDYDAPNEKTIAPQLRFKNDTMDLNLRYSKVRDTGSSRARLSVTEEDRVLPGQLMWGWWAVKNNYFLYDKPVPSVSNCPAGQFTEFGGICGDLHNKVLSNRESLQDNEGDRVSFNADFKLTDTLTLRYTYGDNESHTFGSEDGDGTDRVGSAANPLIPADLDDVTMVACPDLVREDPDTGEEVDVVVGTVSELACWTEHLDSNNTPAFADTENAWFEDDEETSHELQLFSNFDGPFNFVVGIYTYENSSSWKDRQHDWANPDLFTNAEEAATALDLDEDGTLDFASCDDFYQNYVLPIAAEDGEEDFYLGCAPGDDHSFQTGGGAGAFDSTDAIFLNVEYSLNDQWGVSGGIRRTEDSKELIPHINGDHGVTYDFLGVPIWFEVVLPHREDTWAATIGHLSVEYTPQPDLLFYGRISTGFRAGGFNQISGSLASLEQKIPPSFDGEELLNYEVGIKGLFLDNRLMLTAGAYFQDFSKYHLNATQFIEAEKRATYEDPFSEFTDSLGDTEIWGFEVEATLHLSDQWRLSGFYNFLDSSVGPHMAFFDDDRDVPREQFFHTWVDRDCRIDGGSVEECTEISEEPSDLPRAVGGNVLPQQPKHKGALTLTYTQPLGQMGTITALTTWSYTGTRWSDIGNVPYAQLDAYDRLDLRATWDSPGGDWSVTGFVQNVMDNITIQEYAYGNAWLTEPRQMGVQIRWRPNRQ